MSNLDVSRSSKDWKKSAKHGAGEWLAERFTSLALIPLTLWGTWGAFQIAHGGYDAALAFVRVPLNAGLAGLTVFLSVWHMYMGLKVIVDDYIGTAGLRGLLTFLIFLLSAAVLIASLGALYLVHQGA